MEDLLNEMRDKGIGEPDSLNILLIEEFWSYVLREKLMTIHQIRNWNRRCMNYLKKEKLGWHDYIGFLKKMKYGKEADWDALEKKAKATLDEYEQMMKGVVYD